MAERKVLILGACTLRKSEKGTSLILLDDNDKPTGEAMHFSRKAKALKYARIGAVYSGEVTVDDDSVSIGSAFDYVGQFPDADYMLPYKVRHDTTLTHERMEKQRKDDVKQANKGDKDLMLDLLKPLRMIHAGMNEEGRIALEVRILHYLRSGKDKSRGR